MERPDRNLGQAAIQWLLSLPLMASVLPNIYDEAQLRDFAAASESPPLSATERDRVNALYKSNFGLTPASTGEPASPAGRPTEVKA
jgi:aryl-alcohol dehydrogenase-like predicted oxidoreductase